MKKTLNQNNYPWPYFDLIKMYQQKPLIIFDDVKLAFNGGKYLVVQYSVSETRENILLTNKMCSIQDIYLDCW